ncbi:MAG: alpha/beta hydrolase [Candidatus Latescibacterota bacterium]|nr:MAG: alpha/beta hydrolase [Candidatus Latescibacterota bacterium]
MGAYRFDDGRVVSIRRSQDETLRCRGFDTGASRRLYRDGNNRYVSAPGFATKAPVDLVVDFHVEPDGRATHLTWRPQEGPIETARRVGVEVWTTFESDGTLLSGRLDLPEGSGPHPAIVLVHGSGDHAATEYFYNGDFFVAHGIATFTYDKRGTGRSQGEYTFDFQQLARDVVAAVRFLRARPEIDAEQIGLSGYSQGAWVAPLAASLDESVRFVLVSYGMIESPAEEARLETRNLMRERGVDEESLTEVDELTRAAVHVVATGFSEGWDDLAAAKKKYEDAEWRRHLAGTTVEKFVKYPKWLLKWLGPGRSPKALPWYYDSTEVLEDLSIPMVWFLGEADESAPNELTLPKLRRWSGQGKPYELVLFPGADHGMLLFEEVDGRRVYTGYVPTYFAMEVARARALLGLHERSSSAASR